MPKIATTALILKNGKILIGKREKDGVWEFPGGRIDEGETPEQCIIREIEEEVGIKVRIEKTLPTMNGVYRTIPMEVYPFVASWVEGEVKDHVHLETKWIAPEELKNYEFIEEDKELFKELGV